MDSGADRRSSGSARARLLGQLRERLEQAESLTKVVRRALTSGQAREIEDATSRLETILLEYRLLADEYKALADAMIPDSNFSDLEVELERKALEKTAVQVASSSAITGSLLERMVTISRKLLELAGNTSGQSYGPSGRTPALTTGIQLKEQA